jgi:uncharacterized protein
VTAFADSSALVKLYADEADADVVRGQRTFVVSSLARVEVVAALSRKERSGELSADHAGVLVAAFEADWHDARSPFVPVAVGEAVLEEAAALSRRHGLRAYDAVQLACAVSARAADVDLDRFLCFDGELAAAAAREGLPVA